MYMNSYIWLAVVVVLIIIEAGTVNLVSIWFALGALVSLILSFFVDNIYIQAAVFIAISIAALLVTRPFVKRVLIKKKEKTNFDRIIGSEGLVTEEINNLLGTGYIIVEGMEWKAKTENEEILCKGDKVKILRIEGAKVFVEKVED